MLGEDIDSGIEVRAYEQRNGLRVCFAVLNHDQVILRVDPSNLCALSKSLTQNLLN
jgi:hypothetical protein